MKITIYFVGIAFSIGLLRASDAKPNLSDYPPPTTPFVQPVPDKASWVITPSDPKNKESESLSSPSRITRIESIRSGSLKHDIITYKSGKREDVWYINGQALHSNRSGRVIVQTEDALNDSSHLQGAYRLVGNTVKSSGYPGLSWVDKPYYRNTVFFNETIPCYYYALRDLSPGAESDKIIAEAWINVTTGQPVAFSFEGNTYVFRFGEPPSETLSLPSNFSEAYAKVSRIQEHRRLLEQQASALQP